MITDLAGAELDETTALQQIVAALDRRFPDHNAPGDRLGRLLEELGELVEVVVWVERIPVNENDNDLMPSLTKELQDVLRTAAGIAHHYGLPITLTELMTTPDDRLLERTHPFVQLVHITKCAGVVAKAVHHLVGMVIKRDKYGPAGDRAWLAAAVHDVLRRVVQLAEHYELRMALCHSIEAQYRSYQREGYITAADETDANNADDV